MLAVDLFFSIPILQNAPRELLESIILKSGPADSQSDTDADTTISQVLDFFFHSQFGFRFMNDYFCIVFKFSTAFHILCLECF